VATSYAYYSYFVYFCTMVLFCRIRIHYLAYYSGRIEYKLNIRYSPTVKSWFVLCLVYRCTDDFVFSVHYSLPWHFLILCILCFVCQSSNIAAVFFIQSVIALMILCYVQYMIQLFCFCTVCHSTDDDHVFSV